MKTCYYYKEHSTAEGLLWWQETQRSKQRDVQRELSLQSFGGRTESTMLPDSGDISKITIWQTHNLGASDAQEGVASLHLRVKSLKERKEIKEGWF